MSSQQFYSFLNSKQDTYMRRVLLHDTMSLAELMLNTKWHQTLYIIGSQFLGQESNSHYNAHMSCLKKAATWYKFINSRRLASFHKLVLIDCFQTQI